jgi:probable phosphoglycerate mutase
VVRAPGGELMSEVQTRMIAEIADIRQEHPGETVAVVSHSDPLRSVIAHYLSIPIDLILRFDISPASVSVVQLFDDGPRVLCLNHTGELPR